MGKYNRHCIDECTPYGHDEKCHNKELKHKPSRHELMIEVDSLRDLLLDFQSQMGYASPWWIKIEKLLNPNNPALEEKDET